MIDSKTGKEEKVENTSTTQTRDVEMKDAEEKYTGMYDLYAIISHKGRSADSGHYVAFVNNKTNWLKFDDDVVSEVTEDTIKKLSGKGGADEFISYVMIWKPRMV